MLMGGGVQVEQLREQLTALQSEEESLRAAAVTGDASAAAAAAEATERISALELELEAMRETAAAEEERAEQIRQELDSQVAQFHEVSRLDGLRVLYVQALDDLRGICRRVRSALTLRRPRAERCLPVCLQVWILLLVHGLAGQAVSVIQALPSLHLYQAGHTFPQAHVLMFCSRRLAHMAIVAGSTGVGGEDAGAGGAHRDAGGRAERKRGREGRPAHRARLDCGDRDAPAPDERLLRGAAQQHPGADRGRWQPAGQLSVGARQRHCGAAHGGHHGGRPAVARCVSLSSL